MHRLDHVQKHIGSPSRSKRLVAGMFPFRRQDTRSTWMYLRGEGLMALCHRSNAFCGPIYGAAHFFAARFEAGNLQLLLTRPVSGVDRPPANWRQTSGRTGVVGPEPDQGNSGPPIGSKGGRWLARTRKLAYETFVTCSPLPSPARWFHISWVCWRRMKRASVKQFRVQRPREEASLEGWMQLIQS
jgi:hypothetical protein